MSLAASVNIAPSIVISRSSLAAGSNVLLLLMVTRGAEWDEYERSFVRGEATNQPRVTNVPVRIPLPRPKQTGSIYETQSVLGRSTFKNTAS